MNPVRASIVIFSFLYIFSPAARAAGDDVAMLEERLKSPKDNEKVSALYDASKNGSVAAMRLIPPFFTFPNAYISDRAMAAFSQCKNKESFLTVAKECIAKGDVKIKKATVEALLRTWNDFSADMVAPLLHETDEELLALAIEVYISKPAPKVPAEIVKFASPATRNNKLRAPALLAFTRCDAAAAAGALAAASKEKDATMRVAALVARQVAGGATDEAVNALDDPDRRVRLAAMEWLQKARPAAAISKLINNIGREAGRPRIVTLQTLKSLTLRDFGFDAAAWKNWHDQVGPNFTPPAPEPPKGKGKGKPAPDGQTVGGETKVDGPKYYDFIVSSDRVAFVVDVSGSMRAKYTAPGASAAGAGGQKTRLEYAAESLRDVIRGLPKGTRITVIIFNSEPLRYKKGAPLEASPQVAEEVYKFVIGIGASQATNVNDSLELVVDDPEIDTVYLLTDGAPSAGHRNLASRITDWVKRATRFSKTEINTIGFDARDKDADFLRDLAEATGGKFDSK